MDSNRETQSVPAIQKAINVLANFKNKGMTFARREDLENVSQQYQPLVTIIEFQGNDFTRLGGDNAYYPSKAATNRIADAAGVSFLEDVGGTREEGSATAIKFVKHDNYFQVEGHYKVTGRAQGERLKPDGSPRKSSPCEYGYDVVQRTNEALVNDAKATNEDGISAQKIKTEIMARSKFLELQKFAVQKARTGAELGVIRELVGMPTGFRKAEVEKGCQMLFSQIIENNTFKLQVLAEVMKTPDGRAAVIQALFEKTRSVFGPAAAAKQLETDSRPVVEPGDQPPAADQPAPHTVDVPSGEVLTKGSGELPFADDVPWDEEPEDIARRRLSNFLTLKHKNLDNSKIWQDVYGLIKSMVENKAATLEAMQDLIKRIEEWLGKKGVVLPTEKGSTA